MTRIEDSIDKAIDTAADVGTAFLETARLQLAERVDRIRHCVDQLDEDQLWWRPEQSMNSIANLLLHLAGNLGQWVVSGVAGEPDLRQRPAEFAERKTRSRAELMGRFDAVVARVDEVLANFDAALLLEPRRIQGTDQTPMSAIWHSIVHLGGHSQEIIHMTRLQLGDKYRYAWVPASVEQGAPAG